MDIVKLLLLTVLPALVLACIVGLIVGRYQVKKAQGELKSVFSPKQWMAFATSIALGVVCILVGIFYHPSAGEQWEDPWFPDEMDSGYIIGVDDGPTSEGVTPGFEDEFTAYPNDEFLEPSEEIPGEYGEEAEDEPTFTEDDYISYVPDSSSPSTGGSASAQPMPRPASPGGAVPVG